MKRESELGAALQAAAPVQEEIWLLGQAPLRKYLDFVEGFGAGTALADRTCLVKEWSAAADYFDELAVREPGVADNLPCLPLPAALGPLAVEVLASSRYTKTFDTLPTRIAMVELANLVVCQSHVTRSFVDRLKERLGPAPDAAELFHFCLPREDGRAPVQIREAGSKRFVFRSDSTDLRYHESILFKPEQLAGYSSFGAVAGVAGVVIGYSANFLSALCDDDSGRLVLHNGYHRATALLELGVTHAPCVIQTVGSRDELDLVAKAIVANDPGYFFNAPRPPLLKDFADPRIRKILPVRKVSRVIEVSFEVRDYFVED